MTRDIATVNIMTGDFVTGEYMSSSKGRDHTEKTEREWCWWVAKYSQAQPPCLLPKLPGGSISGVNTLGRDWGAATTLAYQMALRNIQLILICGKVMAFIEMVKI